MSGISLGVDPVAGNVGVASGALIEKNIVHDNGTKGGSGIILAGMQGSRLQDNLIYGNGWCGISLASSRGGTPSSNNVVVNNTVSQPYNSLWDLQIGGASSGDSVYNNILINSGPSKGSISISADSLAGFASNYNVVANSFTSNGGKTIVGLSQWQASTGQDLNSFIASPVVLFANPAAMDFHLPRNSPAIEAALPTRGLS